MRSWFSHSRDAEAQRPSPAELNKKEADAELAERFERQKEAEKLTWPKLAAIVTVFLLFAYFTGEAIYESARVLGAFGPVEQVPMSPLRYAVFNNRNAIAPEVCLTETDGFPLHLPMGDCHVHTEEFKKYPVKSLVLGHSITNPGLTGKVVAGLIHVFGSFSSYTLTFAVIVLGGPSFYTPFKKVVMMTLVSLPWEMAVTGSALAILRSPTDTGYPAVNLYPSTAPNSITGGAYNAWTEISRAGFLLAFTMGFAVSGMAEATAFKVYPARVLIGCHALSCLGWLVCLTTFVVQLFTIPVGDWRWSINFYDAFITSVYPLMDLVYVWVLYWGWYKNKHWDWDYHRTFGLSCYVLQTVFAMVYFLTSEKGIVFSTSVPVLWRIFFNMLVIAPWAVFYYVPMVKRIIGLPKAPEALRRPEEWWDVAVPTPTPARS